jgi:hypothetical protein
MEYRSQKATVRILMFAMAATAWGQELTFEVRHQRLLKDHAGRLTLDQTGVEYRRAERQETARWDYQDIQELWLSPEKVVIVPYKDRKWFLGVDKEFEFYIAGRDQSCSPAYEFLKGKLDQRFIAAFADPASDTLWEIPVKLQGVLQGSEGVLQIGPDRIVYKTDQRGQSRTWRYADIENAGTSGPFQLTLTTYERAKMHYGSLKGFNFQLKQRLDDERFNLLWRRLNRAKGLEYLTTAVP